MDNRFKSLCDVAGKTANWLLRLERQAKVQAENNKAHLPAFSASCAADARNYAAVAAYIEAALSKALAK